MNKYMHPVMFQHIYDQNSHTLGNYKSGTLHWHTSKNTQQPLSQT